MRARRVAILLTITAISALTLFLISVLDGEALAATVGDHVAAAVPDTLLAYEETVTIGPDGNSHIEILVVLGSGGLVDLLLPFEYENGDDFSILSGPVKFGRDPDRVEPETIEILGRRMLNLRTLDTAAAGDTVRVAARVADWLQWEAAKQPYGEFDLQRRYVNYSRFVFQEFHLNLVLPRGMVVHAIKKVTPDFDPKKNSTPPFAITRSDDRVRATIATRDLPPAGTVQLGLNIRPGRHGLVPLIGGLIAAVLYLVFFRDVLKPKEVESS